MKDRMKANLSMAAKRQIGDYLRSKYNTKSHIKIRINGAVYIRVDKLPNTNQSGWMFAGWDTALLNESAQSEN